MILGLSVAAAITLGVGSVSTYAWFRTVRTASLNLTDVNLRARTSNLILTVTNMTSGNTSFVGEETGTTTDSDRIVNVNALTNPITDISGDGKTFYKPTFDPHHDDPKNAYGLVASSIKEVKNGTVDTDTGYKYFYVQLGLSLKNSGNIAMSVYVDGLSQITPKDSGTTKDVNAAKATRVALFSVDSKADNATTFTDPFAEGRTVAEKTLWQGTAETDTTKYPYQYLTKDSASTAHEAYTHYEGETPTSPRDDDMVLKAVNTTNFHTGSFTTVFSTKPDTPAAGTSIGSIEAGKQIDLVMSVWAEGTTSYATGDINADDGATDYIDIIGGKAVVDLSFVGFADAITE